MTISLTADGPHEKPYVVTVGGLKMLYGEATAAAFVYQATDRAVVRAVGTLLDDLNRDFHAVIDMKINKVAAASQVG